MATAVQRVCPKCGHVREAVTTSPAWQCPACGIAYDKYSAYLKRVKGLAKVPSASDPAPAIHWDGSIWSLIAANGFTVVIGLLDDWSLASLMIVYWAQSVAIGISNVFRILALDRFSTANFRMNDQPVDPTPSTKRQVAAFFAVHYGFFHAGYLTFILVDAHGEQLIDFWFWACAAAFALNHFWSYRYNRDLDRQGTPNIGTLMFTPYLRIIPMHATIILGGLMAPGAAGLLLFSGLKTVADVGMHAVEHAQLKKLRPAARANT